MRFGRTRSQSRVEERARLVLLEPHPVLAAYRKAGERRALLPKLRDDRLWGGRLLAIHLAGEDVENLLPARRPFGGVLQLASVGKRERILKCVRCDLRLVVVRLSRIGDNCAKHHYNTCQTCLHLDISFGIG